MTLACGARTSVDRAQGWLAATAAAALDLPGILDDDEWVARRRRWSERDNG
jgi:hypothetical protein